MLKSELEEDLSRLRYLYDNSEKLRKSFQQDLDKSKAEIAQLKADLELAKESSDRLAFCVGKLVCSGAIDSRSGAADELLVYLNIGGVNGPSSVPEWMTNYQNSDTGKNYK